MNLSSVANPQVKMFLEQFFRDRAINREFYEKVPEEKFDYRMVDTPQKKSDSPRESIAHQIMVQTEYMKAVETGQLIFGQQAKNAQQLKTLSKQQLLEKMDALDQQLIKMLSKEELCIKKLKVPWSNNPIPAVTMLWSLDSHEILHTGWILALMDHLSIERFPALKAMWG